MKKEVIEIFRDEKAIAGYSYLIPPVQISERGILDFLVKWSEGKSIFIYSHYLDRVEVNFEKYRDMEKYQSPSGPISYCDWIYFLVIYYQEKP